MKNLIKKGDLILFTVFLVSAVLIMLIPAGRSLASRTVSSGNGAGTYQVVIRIAGEEYGRWPLSVDTLITVSSDYGTNTVSIAGDSVRITEADCHNQVCVNSGSISSQGQMIICLPHRLSVEISAEDGEPLYDAVSY